MDRVLKGKAVIPGTATGAALVCREPLSFWGGFDAATGEIIDRRHDRCAAKAAGRILVFPFSKGSSTSSAVLLESIQRGTAPAAIINSKTDPILALGTIIAEELYGRSLPIVVLEPEVFASIQDGDLLSVEEDGTVRVADSPVG